MISKPLKDNNISRREINLHCRACQECDCIVKIKDVYEKKSNRVKMLLVVMEWYEMNEITTVLATFFMPVPLPFTVWGGYGECMWTVWGRYGSVHVTENGVKRCQHCILKKTWQ